jgi:uncharacterized SAM-binding protein YcdF (DUF218 family)
LLLFAAGSLYPHYSANRFPRPASGKTADAILILAGGDKRILTGLEAFRTGLGRQLHVVGTGHSVVPASIIPGYDRLPASEQGRIHLEGWSETTLENAISAKSIVRESGYRSLILVTSDYHMPRAFLALRKAVPDSVAISVIPVRSEWKGGDARWRKAKLFLVEAWKYWGYRLLLRWE